MKIGFASESDISSVMKLQKTMRDRFKRRRALKHGFLVNQVKEETLKKAVKDKRRQLLITAKKGKKVVGYAYAFDWTQLLSNPKWKGKLRFNKIGRKELKGKTVIYLKHVARARQNVGVGVRIEKALIEEAKNAGYDTIVGEILLNPVKNEPSLRVHDKSHGWSEIGKVTYPNGEVWSLVMKNLD